MSRTVKDFMYNGSIEPLWYATEQCLRANKFQPAIVNGEQIFQRGNGFFLAPKFLKITFFQGGIRVEAWMKYAIVPGAFVGEIGLDRFGISIPRAQLKKTVAQIEALCMQFGARPLQDGMMFQLPPNVSAQETLRR